MSTALDALSLLPYRAKDPPNEMLRKLEMLHKSKVRHYRIEISRNLLGINNSERASSTFLQWIKQNLLLQRITRLCVVLAKVLPLQFGSHLESRRHYQGHLCRDHNSNASLLSHVPTYSSTNWINSRSPRNDAMLSSLKLLSEDCSEMMSYENEQHVPFFQKSGVYD